MLDVEIAIQEVDGSENELSDCAALIGIGDCIGRYGYVDVMAIVEVRGLTANPITVTKSQG
jgi:hypothetical protein